MVHPLTVGFDFSNLKKQEIKIKIKTISVVEHKDLLEFVQSKMTKGSVRAIGRGYFRGSELAFFSADTLPASSILGPGG